MAFFPAHAMLPDDEIDVADDLLLRNGMRIHLVVMGKNKPHFLGIIADGADGIMLGHQRLMQRLQALLRSFAKPYLAVLIFFFMVKYFNCEDSNIVLLKRLRGSPKVLVQHGVWQKWGWTLKLRLFASLYFSSGRRVSIWLFVVNFNFIFSIG